MEPPPRAILGTIGSRIRVILGKDGNSWLLLLNHDDGNRQWQTQNWKCIPASLERELGNCARTGRICSEVDFGNACRSDSSTPWYIQVVKSDGTDSLSRWGDLTTEHSKTVKDYAFRPLHLTVSFGEQNGLRSMCLISGENGYQLRNVDSNLAKRIERMNHQSKTIHFVRLFENGGYLIKDGEGFGCKGVTDYCLRDMEEMGSVEEFAFASDGSWLVVGLDSFSASVDIDTELIALLDTFFKDQRQRMSRRDQEREEYRALAIRAAERAARLEAAAERRRAEEEAKRAAQVQASKALESKLVEQLAQEKENIIELEKQLKTMQSHLVARKRSLRSSLKSVPPERRGTLELAVDVNQDATEDSCVICQDAAPVTAIIPCGHICLCEDCRSSFATGNQRRRRIFYCPLCREPVEGTLRVFGRVGTNTSSS